MSAENENKSEFDLIPVVYRHNLWSNVRLLDFCLGLNNEQINHVILGTYGSILETCRHLTNSERYYIYLLTGAKNARADSETPMSTLRTMLQESGEILLDIALTTPGRTAVQVGKDEEAELLPASTILLQAIHHGNEHRTQIGTVLGQLEIEPPELSSWTYFDDEIAPYET